MTVEPEVADIIKSFVAKKQSFISLDVYCKLGKHFDDSDNSIHDQVREAYSTDLMPNYLCKWAHLKLEGGGFAHVWKYYLPKNPVQHYSLLVRSDGRAELTRKILGWFSLLECDLGSHIEPGKITYKLCDGGEDHIFNAANRIIISSNMFKTAKLDGIQKLKVSVYPSKIEITKWESPSNE